MRRIFKRSNIINEAVISGKLMYPGYKSNSFSGFHNYWRHHQLNVKPDTTLYKLCSEVYEIAKCEDEFNDRKVKDRFRPEHVNVTRAIFSLQMFLDRFAKNSEYKYEDGTPDERMLSRLEDALNTIIKYENTHTLYFKYHAENALNLLEQYRYELFIYDDEYIDYKQRIKNYYEEGYKTKCEVAEGFGQTPTEAEKEAEKEINKLKKQGYTRIESTKNGVLKTNCCFYVAFMTKR